MVGRMIEIEHLSFHAGAFRVRDVNLTIGSDEYFVLLGPTGGYLLGFVAAAYIVGHLAQRGWDRTAATTALAMAIGNIVIYACGLLWLGVSQPMGLRSVLAAGLWPFIPGDLLKIALAALLLPGLWKLLGRR